MTMQCAKIEDFRLGCRSFLEKHATPFHDEWERKGLIPRTFWLEAGKAGLLGMGVGEQFGGQGNTDYRFALALTEELIRANVTAPGLICHNDVITSYIDLLGSEEQKQRWLPGLCSGELIAAIAITEPSGGSDATDLSTTAEPIGEYFVLNGHKSFITNGVNADIILVAVKDTSSSNGQAISLLVVERGMAGFSRSEPLNKLGWHGSDTAELYFKDCKVPQKNLLGKRDLGGFYFMSRMPRERLSIASVAVASAEFILNETLAYVKERKAFGQSVGSFQYNRFMLAQLDTEVKIARVYLNHAIEQLNNNAFTVEDSARIKWWATELQVKVADRCLQLHGGSGYLQNSLAGKSWVNSRVQTIYGGTSEVMLEVIGKSLGL